MKKLIAAFAALILFILPLCACSGEKTPDEDSGKLSIVCTNFAEYDFARQVAGDKAEATMLIKPGAEGHTYEPTPQDIIKIKSSDIFMYVGGDSDEWVKSILDSVDTEKISLFRLMECTDVVSEEIKEGMQTPAGEDEGEDGDEEMDEHVWTSPKNAILIVKKLCATLSQIDAENKESYEANAAAYVDELTKLDESIAEVVSTAKRKVIIVGDRFPFRYFCDEFGLDYYAAFPGCSTDTEANPATVSFLIDKVKHEKIPVVFHMELSNAQMASSICEATGAKIEQLNAVHNVTVEDFNNGATYISLMEHNAEVLKEALN